MDYLTATVRVADDDAGQFLVQISRQFLKLRDDAECCALIALFRGDEDADPFAHDAGDDLVLLRGAVRCVAEESVEDRFEPTRHAVEVQRHRVDDAVGGNDLAQQ